MSAWRKITRTLCNTTEYVGVFTRDLEPQIKADIDVMLSFALGTIGLSRVAIQVLTKVIPRSSLALDPQRVGNIVAELARDHKIAHPSDDHSLSICGCARGCQNCCGA